MSRICKQIDLDVALLRTRRPTRTRPRDIVPAHSTQNLTTESHGSYTTARDAIVRATARFRFAWMLVNPTPVLAPMEAHDISSTRHLPNHPPLVVHSPVVPDLRRDPSPPPSPACGAYLCEPGSGRSESDGELEVSVTALREREQD